MCYRPYVLCSQMIVPCLCLMSDIHMFLQHSLTIPRMKLALARWFDSRISVRGSRKYAVEVYREADERDVSDSAHLSSFVCVCVWLSECQNS